MITMKKPLQVFIPFLFANLAKFFAGSMPSKCVNFLSLKGFKAIPSLLPTSIIKALLGLSLNNLIYLFAALLKCFTNEDAVDER